MSFDKNSDVFREIPVLPEHIDIDDFADVSRDGIKDWLALVREDLDSILQARFLEYYEKEPPKTNYPSHYLSYCPEEVRSYLGAYARTGSRKRFLWSTVYISTRYNVSCHELLFGTKYPLDLFGRTKAFVGIVSGLKSASLRIELRQCLTNGFLETNSPLFIFRHRCLEAGFAQGFPFYKINAAGFGSPLQSRIISQVFEDNLSHRQEDYTSNDLINCRPGFDIMLRFCLKFFVSADYLLLQDYSEFATMNGKPLTQEQKEWLSLYLCASPEAQKKAIAIMSKYLIDQAEERATQSQ